MRHLPQQRRVVLLQSLLAGDSIKKAASRAGTGNEVVSHTILDLGAACRDHHDRTVHNLTVDTVRCRRVWGFSYVRRRNAYTPEINRGVPREGWVWVAQHPESGLVVDWTVSSGDAPAARTFLDRVRGRLHAPLALEIRGEDIMLGPAPGAPATGGSAMETALLTRQFGTETDIDGDEPVAPGPGPGDFRRRCLNLELALSLHFTSHNALALDDAPPPAVQLGLMDRAWSLETLADMA